MTAAIIDDELPVQEALEALIALYTPQIRITGTADRVEKAQALLLTHKPDIIFLDINLGPQSGFDLLDTLAQSAPAVIFITAYDQYALKAFDYNAIDYLLKPIDGEKLQRAVEKAVKRDYADKVKALEAARSIMKDLEGNLQSLYISTRTGAEIVRVKELLYIKAEGNYCQLILVNGEKIMTSRLLKSFEAELAGNERFMRVHKSYIANLGFIRSLDRSNGGQLTFTNGHSIPATYFDQLRVRLERRHL